MADGWKYSKAGQIRGPVTADEIRRLVSAGELSDQDMVLDPSRGVWEPVAGLRLATGPTATAMPPIVGQQSAPGTLPAKAMAPRPGAPAKPVSPSPPKFAPPPTRHPPEPRPSAPRRAALPATPAASITAPAGESPVPPKRRANPWAAIAAVVVVSLAVVVVLSVWMLRRDQDRRQRAAERLENVRLVLDDMAKAEDLIASQRYKEAKTLLIDARNTAVQEQGLEEQISQIDALLKSPEIIEGAAGKLQLDGQWYPADLVRQTVAQRTKDQPEIDRLLAGARQDVQNSMFAAGIARCDKALALVTSHAITTKAERDSIVDLRAEITRRQTVSEMKAKGLVLHGARWVTPAEDFRLTQVEKGLVEYKGKWLSEAEAFAQQQRDKGLVFYAGRWMTHDQEMEARGYVEFEGNWITPERRDAIQAERAEAARRVEQQKETAYLMSQEFIKDKLKSPTSARFQPYDDRHVIVSLIDGWYLVSAPVDAQNVLGTYLRKTYVCKLRPKPGTTLWECDTCGIPDD